MKVISRAIRVYIHKKGRVMIRVRWNRAKSECAFSTECNADPSKWNKEAGRAKLNTTHVVNGTTYSAKEINARIENAEDLINQAIYQFEVQEKIPTVEELKVSVNKMLKPVLADYKLETENGEETKGQFL